MAKVTWWSQKSLARKITCSHCTDLIANQEYSVGHPHMHLTDGFQLTFSQNTTLTSLEQLEKVGDWGPVVHLEPKTSQRLPTVVSKTRAFIDPDYLPNDRGYLLRTGLAPTARIPAIMGKKKIPIMDKSKSPAQQKTDKDGHPMWVKNKDGTDKELDYVITPEVPARPGTIPHSIFEDGESAVMSLAAVLNSKAGALALEQLKSHGKVVIFSHTGVKALVNATKFVTGKNVNDTLSTHSLRGKAIKMNEWRHDPLGNTFTPTSVAIEHLVTVLKSSSSKDLILTTHYPSSGPFEDTPNDGVRVTNMMPQDKIDMVEWTPSTGGTVLRGLAIDSSLPPIEW
jgi:hypothetical protein